MTGPGKQHQEGPRARALGWCLYALAGVLGLACFHQYELLSGFGGISTDRGDGRFIAFTLEHTYQALRGLSAVASPPIFYPVTGTLGYSDVLLGVAPVYWLLRTAGVGLLPACMWTVVVGNLLTYVAALGLLRRGLHLGRWAAVAGALLFAFNSAKLNQLNHPQLQPLYLLVALAWVLVFLYQQRATLTGRRSLAWLTLAGLLFSLQLYTSVYMGWFFAFQCLLLGVVGSAWPAARAAARAWLRAHRASLAGAAALTTVTLIPFAWLYLSVVHHNGWRRFVDVEGMLPRAWSYLNMGPDNFVWGWLSERWPQFGQLPLPWEHRIGLGLVVSAFGLALLAAAWASLWRGRRRQPIPAWVGTLMGTRDDQQLAVLATASATVGLLYMATCRCMGLESPWWLVFQTVPGARSIRAVARFVLVALLPTTCVMAAVLDNHIGNLRHRAGAAGRRWRAAALTWLVLLALAEQLGRTHGFAMAEDWARIEQLSRQLGPGCQVFYITAGDTVTRPLWELQLDAMLVATLTRVPTVNGYSGQIPPGWTLEDPHDLTYAAGVKRWLRSTGLNKRRVCRVATDQ